MRLPAAVDEHLKARGAMYYPASQILRERPRPDRRPMSVAGRVHEDPKGAVTAIYKLVATQPRRSPCSVAEAQNARSEGV